MKSTMVKIGLGVAAALVLVCVSRCGGDDTAPPAGRQPTTVAVGPTSPVPTTPEVTPPGADDDGVVGTGYATAPVTAGPTDPAAAAQFFAVKYVKILDPRWRDGWRPLVTPELAEQLTGVDPKDVPVGPVGTPTLEPIGDGLVLAAVPVVGAGGSFLLTLTGNSGRWLVSDIDWRAGS